jgi:hypothetical protein
VSVASSPSVAGSAPAGPAPSPVPGGESCPLCGAPLHPEQEWCLNCGAAARTRLAASPGWRGPIIALMVVLVLSLGVLAGALVKLAGGSTPPPATTTTVTSAVATSTTAPTTTTTTPGTTTTTPTSTKPVTSK